MTSISMIFVTLPIKLNGFCLTPSEISLKSLSFTSRTFGNPIMVKYMSSAKIPTEKFISLYGITCKIISMSQNFINKQIIMFSS